MFRPVACVLCLLLPVIPAFSQSDPAVQVRAFIVLTDTHTLVFRGPGDSNPVRIALNGLGFTDVSGTASGAGVFSAQDTGVIGYLDSPDDEEFSLASWTEARIVAVDDAGGTPLVLDSGGRVYTCDTGCATGVPAFQLPDTTSLDIAGTALSDSDAAVLDATPDLSILVHSAQSGGLTRVRLGDSVGERAGNDRIAALSDGTLAILSATRIHLLPPPFDPGGIRVLSFTHWFDLRDVAGLPNGGVAVLAGLDAAKLTRDTFRGVFRVTEQGSLVPAPLVTATAVYAVFLFDDPWNPRPILVQLPDLFGTPLSIGSYASAIVPTHTPLPSATASPTATATPVPSSTPAPSGDLNGDGTVNEKDLLIMIRHMRTPLPSANP